MLLRMNQSTSIPATRFCLAIAAYVLPTFPLGYVWSSLGSSTTNCNCIVPTSSSRLDSRRCSSKRLFLKRGMQLQQVSETGA
jgi:hypothetical protein